MNVPKLRFKEFDGEWEENKLSNLLVKIEEKATDATKGVVLTSSRTGLFPRSEYFNGREEKDIEGYSIIPKNTFTYRQMSDDNTFHINYNTKYNLGLVSPEYPVFKTNNFLTDEYFLNYINNSPRFKKHCVLQKKGGTRTRLYFKVLGELVIAKPSIEEQKKIGDFFNLLNKKIQLQQQKIDLLQEQKKGYMQEIFSQENKNLKYIKLEDAFDERNEKGFPEYELLAVTLKNGVTDRTDMKKDTSSDDKSNYKRVKVGDIAYNSMRMWQGASGYSNYNGIVSPAYTVLIPKENIDSQFFAYLFKTNFMIYQFKKYSQGLTSDTWNLKYPLLKEIKVKIPSLDQQKRIVEFFTKIDLYINLQKKRLDILKNQKKGFMQQMFI